MALFEATEASLLRQIGDAATSPRAKSRLRAMLRTTRAELAELRRDVAAWLTGELPGVFAAGATDAATAAGSDFLWSAVHREAVQALAERTWANAAETLRDVEAATMREIRRLLDDATRAQILEGLPGVTNSRAFTEALRRETGLLSVRYSDGSLRSIADYGDMLARTDSAMAQNLGAFGQMQGDGIEMAECFDGNGCHLGPGHNVGPIANGLILPLEEAMLHPLSHPRCARSWAPAVGETERRQRRPAEQVAREAAEEDARAAAFLVTGERRGALSLAREPRSPRQPRTARAR